MTHLPGSRGNRYRNPRFPTGEANLRLPFQAEQPQYNVHPMEYCARVTCPPNVVPNYNPQMRPPFPGPDSMTYSPPVLNHLDPLYSEQSTRFTIPPPIPSAQVYVPPYQTPQSTLHTWSSEQVPGNNCTSFPQNSVSSTAETWHNTVPFPEEVPKELIRPKLEQLVPILWHSKKEPKFEVDKIGENTYPPIFKDATDIRVKQEYTSPDNCEEKGNNTPSRRKSNSPLSRQRTPPLSNQIREPSSKQRSRTPTPRRRSKSPSSIRSSKTSSTRQSSRTPSSRRSRTPSKQRSRTPSRRRSRTPSRRRLKTPSRRRSRTPSRQRTRTPSRRRSRTPSRRRSRTPLRRRSRTPSRRRSRTPSRRRSRTASRRRSRTPSRQRSRTASRRRSRTPSRRRSRTPSRRRSRTPSRRRSRTPSSRLGSRSRSPLSRFSSKTHSSRCHSKTPPSRRRSKRALSRHRSKTPRSRRRSRTPLSRRKQRSRSLSCRRGRRSRDRSSNYDRSRRSYSLSRAQSSRSRKRSTSSRRTATKSDTRQSHSSDSDKGYSQTKKSYSRSPDFHNSKENLESPPANTTASQGPEDEASRSFSPAKTLSERQCVLEKYRMDYCANSAEMHRKLEEISRLKPEEIVELEKKVWTRTAPADLFYAREKYVDTNNQPSKHKLIVKSPQPDMIPQSPLIMDEPVSFKNIKYMSVNPPSHVEELKKEYKFQIHVKDEDDFDEWNDP